MIKRITVTLNIKEGKPGDMSVVPENTSSRLDMLMLLNLAMKAVLEDVAKNTTQESMIRVVKPGIRMT